MGKRINSSLPVCPGQVWTVWTLFHNWAALSTVPPNGRGGERKPVFLQGSALPQPLTFQDLGRTPLVGHSVPRTSQVPATPRAPQPHSRSCGCSQLLNSLCHDRVYVGPHQPQVLINLCLQRARGDQVNEATMRQSQPDTPNAPQVQTDLPGTCHIQRGE